MTLSEQNQDLRLQHFILGLVRYPMKKHQKYLTIFCKANEIEVQHLRKFSFNLAMIDILKISQRTFKTIAMNSPRVKTRSSNRLIPSFKNNC